MERLNVKGQDVLVTGCGPVGLMAQAVAKALGAKRSVRKQENSYLYLYKYANVCLSVCLSVCSRFLGHFETDWDTLWY